MEPGVSMLAQAVVPQLTLASAREQMLAPDMAKAFASVCKYPPVAQRVESRLQLAELLRAPLGGAT